MDDPTLWDDHRGVEWVSIGDMTRSRIVRDGTRRVSERGMAEKRLPIGTPGTVLFAMYASLGTVAVLGVEATWNQAILGVQARDGVADNRFIAYWLDHLARDLSALARSNTQDNLNAEQVSNLPFPSFAVEHQRHIADFLDAETARIDALIGKKRKMIGLLRERLVSARREIFDRLTSSSGEITLRRCVRCLDGRRIPLNSEERTERQGVYPYWGAGTIVDHIDDFLFDEPLVLLGEDGAPFFDDSRDVAFHIDERVWVNNHIHVLRPAGSWSPRFLMHMLNSVDFSRYITGSTRDKLTQAEMGDIRIPVASSEQQECVVGELDVLERRATEVRVRLSKQIDLLREHRQAVITAAVTGQLNMATAAA